MLTGMGLNVNSPLVNVKPRLIEAVQGLFLLVNISKYVS